MTVSFVIHCLSILKRNDIIIDIGIRKFFLIQRDCYAEHISDGLHSFRALLIFENHFSEIKTSL